MVHVYDVRWEPEGHYCSSKMFRWEPEGCYRCIKSMAIAPLWFSTEHLWSAITPFSLSTDDVELRSILWKLGALAACLLQEPRTLGFWGFWGEKATIGNILPIFNPVILNFELFQSSATLSKMKSIGLDDFLKWQKWSEWGFPWIYYPWSCKAKKATGIPHHTICQGALNTILI